MAGFGAFPSGAPFDRGNVTLRSRDPSTFRFSMLERVGPDAPPDEVIALENTWKETAAHASHRGLTSTRSRLTGYRAWHRWPFVERGLADPTDHVLLRGCHGVLDRATDGVDPQNAQPAFHCDRGRDAADAVWRAVSGCGAQGQRPGAGLCR